MTTIIDPSDFPQFRVFTSGNWESVDQVFVQKSGDWVPVTGMSVVATVTPYRYSNYNWYKHPSASYQLIEGHDPVDPDDPSTTAYKGWGSFWRIPVSPPSGILVMSGPPYEVSNTSNETIRVIWDGPIAPSPEDGIKNYVVEVFRWEDDGSSKKNGGNPVARFITNGDANLSIQEEVPSFEVRMSDIPQEFRPTNTLGSKWSVSVRALSGSIDYLALFSSNPNTNTILDGEMGGGFSIPSAEVKWQLGSNGTLVEVPNYAWVTNNTIRRPDGWTAISTFPPTSSGTVAKIIDGSDAAGTGTEWIHSSISTTVYNSTFNRMFGNNPTLIWVDLKPPVFENVSGVNRAVSKVRVRQVKVTQYGLIGRNAFGIQSWGEQVMSIERAGGGGTIGFISGTADVGPTGNQWSEVRVSDIDIYNYFISTTPMVKQEYRLGSKTWTRASSLEVRSEDQVIRAVIHRFAPNDLNNPGTSRASIAEISMEYDVYREDGTTTTTLVGQVNSGPW